MWPPRAGVHQLVGDLLGQQVVAVDVALQPRQEELDASDFTLLISSAKRYQFAMKALIRSIERVPGPAPS